MPTDWTPTNWRPPRAEKVRVMFRNKDESKWEYHPKQLVWTDRGEPFDVTHWKAV